MINSLILATERSCGSIGQQDLIDVRLAKHRYPATGAQPISFWHVGADLYAKETPAEGRGLGSSD